MWYQNICSASFSFVTMHACDRQTDGRTDKITTPKTALAYARAVKIVTQSLTQHFCVYGMVLYWPTLQFYLRVYVIRIVCLPVRVAPLLCCEDYFPSSSVVSRAFSVPCLYSKLGHHPYLLGYLCAKFRFFRDLHY